VCADDSARTSHLAIRKGVVVVVDDDVASNQGGPNRPLKSHPPGARPLIAGEGT